MSKITIREATEEQYGIYLLFRPERQNCGACVEIKEDRYPDNEEGDVIVIGVRELPALIAALQTIRDKCQEENP